jgi:ParB family chromosome partitioning protein
MEKRLGRGLGSLLPGKVPSGSEAGPAMIPVGEIRPNRFQPRRSFDEASLSELRDSIRVHGVLQPIAVRRDGDRFELIAGERRWRAAQQAGLARIPAVVREQVSDGAMLELALVENVQRQDLNPIERARGFQQMVEQIDLTQEQVADRVGLKRATVANHLRLLDLEPAIQGLVAEGALSMGHARALLGMPEGRVRMLLADRILHEGLSVRATEQAVRDHFVPPEAAPATPAAPEVPARASQGSSQGESEGPAEPWVKTLTDRLQRALGARVQIKNRSGFEGQIQIEYVGRTDLDRLMDRLAPVDQI